MNRRTIFIIGNVFRLNKGYDGILVSGAVQHCEASDLVDIETVYAVRCIV